MSKKRDFHQKLKTIVAYEARKKALHCLGVIVVIAGRGCKKRVKAKSRLSKLFNQLVNDRSVDVGDGLRQRIDSLLRGVKDCNDGFAAVELSKRPQRVCDFFTLQSKAGTSMTELSSSTSYEYDDDDNNNNFCDHEAGAAAKFAASRKTAKYVSLAASHLFFPIVVETQGPLNEEARQLPCDLGRRISASSGDDREVNFLFQRVSVVVPHFNAVLLHDSFSIEDHLD